jgi:hypothetical protein
MYLKKETREKKVLDEHQQILFQLEVFKFLPISPLQEETEVSQYNEKEKEGPEKSEKREQEGEKREEI